MSLMFLAITASRHAGLISHQTKSTSATQNFAAVIKMHTSHSVKIQSNIELLIVTQYFCQTKKECVFCKYEKWEHPQ